MVTHGHKDGAEGKDQLHPEDWAFLLGTIFEKKGEKEDESQEKDQQTEVVEAADRCAGELPLEVGSVVWGAVDGSPAAIIRQDRAPWGDAGWRLLRYRLAEEVSGGLVTQETWYHPELFWCCGPGGEVRRAGVVAEDAAGEASVHLALLEALLLSTGHKKKESLQEQWEAELTGYKERLAARGQERVAKLQAVAREALDYCRRSRAGARREEEESEGRSAAGELRRLAAQARDLSAQISRLLEAIRAQREASEAWPVLELIGRLGYGE